MKLPTRAPLAGALLLPLGLFSGGCEMMIAGPRAQATDLWEKTYQVAPTARLWRSRTPTGPSRSGPTTQPTIQVTAHRTARAVSEQGARDLLARTKLEESAIGRPRPPRHASQSGPVDGATHRGPLRDHGAGDGGGHPHDRQRQGRARWRHRRRGARDRQWRHRGAWRDGPAQGRDRQRQRLASASAAFPAQGARIETVNGSVTVTMPTRASAPTSRSGPSTAASRSTASANVQEARAQAPPLRGQAQRRRPDAARRDRQRRRLGQRPETAATPAATDGATQ